MSDTLVKVDNVSKKFCRSLKRSLWYGVRDTFAEFTGKSGHDDLRKNEFWAVKDVSFELKRGECLGLIGRNGAGKSTLLKMLNGLIKPDQGRIEMHGRIGALIELSAGFNPVLTGRENIYNKGSILGFSKNEINEKFDAIVDFAEIGEFIDSPVRNYSSGMKVRLGFAVSAQMEPDVLIIDEVLAVGDLGFRAKCFNAITDIADKTAVMFVSHNPPIIGRMCTDILLLEGGSVSTYGKHVAAGLAQYLDLFATEKLQIMGSGEAILDSVTLNGDQCGVPEIYHLEDLVIELRCRVFNTVDKYRISLAIFDQNLKCVAQIFSLTKDTVFRGADGPCIIRATLPKIALNPGKYTLTVNFVESPHGDYKGKILARYRAVRSFRIRGPVVGHAPFQLPANWEIPRQL